MARIAYSFSGEGRGHATRAETVISMLSDQHSLLVYAPPIAYEILNGSLRDHPNVTIRRLDCLRFQYRGQRLSYLSSIASAAPFLAKMPARLRRLRREICQWNATHVISDFEPLISRVATLAKLPLISLDHQHFLSLIDPRCLPTTLAWKVRMLRASVPLFCPRPHQKIVSSYYDYPIRSGESGAHKVGALLRRCVHQARSERGNHVIAYLRRDLPRQLERSLLRLRNRVYVYGLGAAPNKQNLRFMPTSADGFLEHLRSCAALVCSSGNQLIGEAIHLRKPVLAIPEHGNFEQELNGFFLPRTGGGETHPRSQIYPSLIGDFLERRERYESAAHAMPCGNDAVGRLVGRFVRSDHSAPQLDPPFEVGRAFESEGSSLSAAGVSSTAELATASEAEAQVVDSAGSAA